MKHYGLLGRKLGHSWSAPIHEAILNHLNMEGAYGLYPTEEGNVSHLLDRVRSGELDGLNVTIPYKSLVMPYLDTISEEAKAIGAVNTISRKGHDLAGYNTDYFGFHGLLQQFAVPIQGQHIMVLGSGGASRTVVACLKAMKVKTIILVSRSPENAADTFEDVKVLGYDELKGKNIDVLVNTTPAGMKGFLQDLPMDRHAIPEVKVAVDLIYNPLETPLLKHCKEHGVQTVNGLYMLVAQAVKAQEIWQETTIDEEIIDAIYTMMLGRMA